MSQSTQQQQQQHDSNSNCNVSKPQSQPSLEELEAWLMSGLDPEELEAWLMSDPPGPEELEILLATQPDTNTQQEATTVTAWTRLQDKAFENALMTCPEGIENRWDRIAALVPGGKTTAQVKQRYQELLHDISLIESGRHVDLTEDLAAWAEEMAATTNVYGGRTEHAPTFNGNGRECRWTAEEHKLFLIGLKQFGKGKWTDISRHCVKTKTPQQVASHAQKYYYRQIDTEKRRKRKSIHDITIENNNPVPQLPSHSRS